MHLENESPHKISWLFQHKVGYEGDTNENNCYTNYPQSENDDFVINLKKNNIIDTIMNARNILLWLLKQMNVIWANIKKNKHR